MDYRFIILYVFCYQWPGKLAAAFHLLSLPQPALYIQKKPVLPVRELQNICDCSTLVSIECCLFCYFFVSTLFTELRILLEHFIMKPACPAFFRRMCLSSIAFVSRLAPTGVWSPCRPTYLLLPFLCSAAAEYVTSVLDEDTLAATLVDILVLSLQWQLDSVLQFQTLQVMHWRFFLWGPRPLPHVSRWPHQNGEPPHSFVMPEHIRYHIPRPYLFTDVPRWVTKWSYVTTSWNIVRRGRRQRWWFVCN